MAIKRVRDFCIPSYGESWQYLPPLGEFRLLTIGWSYQSLRLWYECDVDARESLGVAFRAIVGYEDIAADWQYLGTGIDPVKDIARHVYWKPPFTIPASLILPTAQPLRELDLGS